MHYLWSMVVTTKTSFVLVLHWQRHLNVCLYFYIFETSWLRSNSWMCIETTLDETICKSGKGAMHFSLWLECVTLPIVLGEGEVIKDRKRVFPCAMEPSSGTHRLCVQSVQCMKDWVKRYWYWIMLMDLLFFCVRQGNLMFSFIILIALNIWINQIVCSFYT